MQSKFTTKTAVYTTADESLACAVRNAAQQAGCLAAIRCADRAGDVVYRVEVAAASAAQLRAIGRAGRARMNFHRAWQFFCSAPTSAAAWRVHFRKYVSARWFDSSHPLAEVCAKFWGEDAFEPEVTAVVEAYDRAGVYDLRDPDTLALWLEYLSEYPERRAAWRAYERANGAQNQL
jgi:hypothetical protein